MKPQEGRRPAVPHRPFAQLSRRGAALVLALLAGAMIWSAVANLSAPTVPTSQAAEAAPKTIAAPSRPEPGTGDMALYARIHARLAQGEGYYASALAEQRATGYPTRPFVAVRLPTLAWAQVMLGADGVRWLALALAAAAIAALWLPGGVPLVSRTEQIIASALLAAGGGAALVPVAAFDHDFIAGLLLTLALLAYRPDRWGYALLAAATALAVRELAAPFMMLWLAFALGERRWREAAAVAGVLGIFALGLAFHAAAVEAARLPGDLASQGWSARAGYGLPLAGLGQLTGLRHLPPILAAPLGILPLVGWAGVGGRAGRFASLWFAGLATMMALFARPANFYWAELALPAYAVGLACAPRALAELFAQAVWRSSKQT